jgi:hypothetical protein
LTKLDLLFTVNQVTAILMEMDLDGDDGIDLLEYLHIVQASGAGRRRAAGVWCGPSTFSSPPTQTPGAEGPAKIPRVASAPAVKHHRRLCSHPAAFCRLGARQPHIQAREALPPVTRFWCSGAECCLRDSVSGRQMQRG